MEFLHPILKFLNGIEDWSVFARSVGSRAVRATGTLAIAALLTEVGEVFVERGRMGKLTILRFRQALQALRGSESEDIVRL